MNVPVDLFHEMIIPSFGEFLRRPNESFCAKLDSRRLLVEIIGGVGTFSNSSYSSKMLLGGDYSLVIRYQREKDNIYHPTCALSMNFQKDKVIVSQLQGSNDKSVAFRFASSFDTVSYFAMLLEETFIKRGIAVEVEKLPEGIEGSAHVSGAITKYQKLAHLLGSAQARNMETIT